MNKLFIVLALIALVLFSTGCTTTTEDSATTDGSTVQTAPEVTEATTDIIDADTVEIGEMI